MIVAHMSRIYRDYVFYKSFGTRHLRYLLPAAAQALKKKYSHDAFFVSTNKTDLVRPWSLTTRDRFCAFGLSRVFGKNPKRLYFSTEGYADAYKG